MGCRVRIRLFHILHFVMDFLFPLLKNSKSGVNDRGHRLRSGSPVTNLPGASATTVNHFIAGVLNQHPMDVLAFSCNRCRKLSDICWLLSRWDIPDLLFHVPPNVEKFLYI